MYHSATQTMAYVGAWGPLRLGSGYGHLHRKESLGLFFLCLFSLLKITLIAIAISSDCCLILELPTVIKAEKEWPVSKHVQFGILQRERTNSLAKVPN